MCDDCTINPYWGFYQRLNLPVWASRREVIRASLRKIIPAARSNRLYREVRQDMLRAVLDAHESAGSLYRYVATGDRIDA